MNGKLSTVAHLRRGHFGLVIGYPRVRKAAGEIIAASCRVNHSMETLKGAPHRLEKKSSGRVRKCQCSHRDESKIVWLFETYGGN